MFARPSFNVLSYSRCSVCSSQLFHSERLFCSVLSLLRLSILMVAALGRFAPMTVLHTLSWLVSSAAWRKKMQSAVRCSASHLSRPAEVLLAVSFAWGPVLLDILQSLVLLLHVNPFDTGDLIIFRGNYLQVQQIKLLNTVFRDLCDEVGASCSTSVHTAMSITHQAWSSFRECSLRTYCRACCMGLPRVLPIFGAASCVWTGDLHSQLCLVRRLRRYPQHSQIWKSVCGHRTFNPTAICYQAEH